MKPLSTLFLLVGSTVLADARRDDRHHATSGCLRPDAASAAATHP
jgi:hypothetical protein